MSSDWVLPSRSSSGHSGHQLLHWIREAVGCLRYAYKVAFGQTFLCGIFIILAQVNSLMCVMLLLYRMHTHTTVKRLLSGTTRVGRYQKKHPPTQHPSWSSDILYQLPPFTMIRSILCVQFTCLTVLFDNLSPGPLWSSCWSWALYFIPHEFLHPVIIFFFKQKKSTSSCCV